MPSDTSSTLPRLPEEGLALASDLIESAYRFETPATLPFFFWEAPHDVDPGRDRFVDQHAVEMQLNRWGDWEKQVEEFLAGVRWWRDQQFSPITHPLRIPLFCPQEMILTPLGIECTRLDENRIRIEHGEPVVKSVEDVDRLEELSVGFLGRGLLPDILARARWMVGRTGGEYAVAYPDFQSPLGLVSKLMDSTDFIMWTIEEPEAMQRLMKLMGRMISELLTALAEATGSPKLVQSPYLLPGHIQGTIWDDYVSVLGPDIYCSIVPESNDELLERYGGGHLHTCGPCMGPITDAILANENVKSFDVIFANPRRERTTEHILALKERCAGRAVLNVIGMPYDLENFTPDFVKRVNEGGGVMFTACGGSREQLLRWHEIIAKATN